MIDLTASKRVLEQCDELMLALDGEELDERKAVVDQSKGEARKRRAQLSQDLQLLASRLELAAALVRNEYWFARGEDDPIQIDRRYQR